MEIVGIDEAKVKEISKVKQEDEWILNYRLDSYKKFCNLGMPSFGPKYDIDFDKIIYYKKTDEKLENSWDKVNSNIKCEFSNLGVIDSERKVDGIGVQYESEVIYHNMIEELEKKNVIFTSIEDAMKKYPDLVKKIFLNYCKK